MNIAIAGYGLEGKASYDYWSKDPANVLTIFDERAEAAPEEFPEGANVVLGPSVFEQLDEFDVVVRTAGLAPSKIKTNGKVWSATNEFFAQCPAPIIGVTGSKGKGTTASFITSILEAAGKKVWLVGNIGLPGLGVLGVISPSDIVVYELSSFQLWDAQYSPHVSVVLFIEPEHLDVHDDMDDYLHAKAHIVHGHSEDDKVVYNHANENAHFIARQSKGQLVPFPSAENTHVRDGYFWHENEKICPTSVLRIKGRHNIENAIAAIDACWTYTQEPTAIEAGLKSFAGLPHRLAFVDTVNGVDYYDDSIATIPGAAIAALQAFGDQPKIILLGGSYKGSTFDDLATELIKQNATALLMGDEADRIAEACDRVGFTDYQKIPAESPQADDTTSFMERLVQKAASIAQPGSVVLLSPAAASFGLFKNYNDRGDQFIEAVGDL